MEQRDYTNGRHKEMRKSLEHNPCNKVNRAEVKQQAKELKE
jgi:hypothetical protein